MLRQIYWNSYHSLRKNKNNNNSEQSAAIDIDVTRVAQDASPSVVYRSNIHLLLSMNHLISSCLLEYEGMV